MERGPASDHKIEPEHFGPLADRPLIEMAKRSDPADLFPGASLFLSARQQKKRRQQWEAVRPLAGRLLRADERILYVAQAMQIPPVLQSMALGAFVYAYHQAVLVFTDSRIIEVLLNFRGNGPGTRIRTFDFAGVRGLKLSFGKLTLQPVEGKKQAWRFPIGGDKKLLKLLLPRLQTRLVLGASTSTGALPQWHCPQCGAAVPANPDSCAACGTLYRSSRLATWLSLAFPGAGLLYVGHPFLAAADFLGEVLLFTIWVAVAVADSGDDGIGPTLALGAFFFVATKFQSIHLGHVLVARSVPETPRRRQGFRRFAAAGAALSALLVLGAFPLAGSARPRLEHDLDASTDDGAWSGSRVAAEWGYFKDDRDARSQWTHAETGVHVTVFAYAQGLLDELEQFHRDWSRIMKERGVGAIADDDSLPPPFHGFRYIGEVPVKGGEPLAQITYFLFDLDGHDIHQVFMAVPREDADAADAIVRDFLAHARWIDSTPPERPAAPPEGAASPGEADAAAPAAGDAAAPGVEDAAPAVR